VPAVNKQNNLAKKAVKSCLVPRRLSFFEGQERAKDKEKGKRPLSLSHGPSHFKLITNLVPRSLVDEAEEIWERD